MEKARGFSKILFIISKKEHRIYFDESVFLFADIPFKSFLKKYIQHHLDQAELY